MIIIMVIDTTNNIVQEMSVFRTWMPHKFDCDVDILILRQTGF